VNEVMGMDRDGSCMQVFRALVPAATV
jgi:hypothetical protein